MTTPAGEPCTKTTNGVLVPTPVSIAGRKITGKESHRLAERQTGLTPVAGETQVFAKTREPPAPATANPAGPCQKPGCPELVTGRRLWCPRHAVASSIDKKRWRGDWASSTLRELPTVEAQERQALGNTEKNIAVGVLADLPKRLRRESEMMIRTVGLELKKEG